MHYDVVARPSHALLEVTLDEGERLLAEPGRMVTRSRHVGVESSVTGGDGVLGVAKRVASDERDLLENTFYAHADGGTVRLAPIGNDVLALNVSETGRLVAQSGALLAWEPLVERSTALNDSSHVFSTGELTVLALSGRGTAFLSTRGAVFEREVVPAEPLTADEHHVVAWAGDLDLSRHKGGSLKSAVIGGEGFVTEFSGHGTVWLQTRSPPPART